MCPSPHTHFPNCTLLKGVTMHSLPLSSGGGYQYVVFRIRPYGRFISSPPFINVFNYLNISIWTHGYLVSTLGYNPILFYLFILLKLFSLWPLGAAWSAFSRLLTFTFQHSQSTSVYWRLLCAMPCASHSRPTCGLVHKWREGTGRRTLEVRTVRFEQE